MGHGDRPEVGKYAKEGRQMQHAADLRDELKAKTYMMSFGPINRINVLDTNVLRQVFKSKQKHFHKSPMTASLLEPLLGMQGLFLMELPEHKKYRSLINSAFHFENLGSMVSIMVDACKRQFPEWRKQMVDQAAVGNTGLDGFGKMEMHSAWNGLGLEIVVGSVLGANFQDAETQSVMYTTFNTLVAAILKRFLNMTSVLPIIRDLPLESKKFVDAGVKRARSVVAKIIKLRKEGKSKALCKGDDLLDILLRVKDESGRAALTEEQILDQTMTFVFAGHEPTSNLLTWAIWCLAKYPECRAKLYKEIDDVLGNEPPTYEKIGKKTLPYMNAFLNEVLLSSHQRLLLDAKRGRLWMSSSETGNSPFLRALRFTRTFSQFNVILIIGKILWCSILNASLMVSWACVKPGIPLVLARVSALA